MENYSGRRLLGQCSPNTGQRITILADKGKCRKCVQFCSGRLHRETLDASSLTEHCTKECLVIAAAAATRHLWECIISHQPTGAESGKRAERGSRQLGKWPRVIPLQELERRDESTIEKEPEFKGDFRIGGIAQDVVLKDEVRMGKIQDVVGNLRNGSRTKSILEDLGKPGNSMKVSEESSRIIHEMGNIELYELGQVTRTVPCHSCCGDICRTLFLWRVSSTWWSNNKKVRSKMPSFDSTSLSCSNLSTTGQEAWRNSVATRPLESNGCQQRSKETWKGHNHNQVATGWEVKTFSASPWTEEYCRYLDFLITIDISYIAPRHQRHLYESTITLACNDEDRQAGPMKARKDFGPTTKILASLRQEQGRQNSFIPKNERMRQRPFDEALRAKSEWMSQNWTTDFSQPSSSSSSQNWWQHEHQDSQWRENQDTQWRDHQWRNHYWWIRRFFQGVSLAGNSDSLVSDGRCGQNTSSRAHFSQSFRVAHWAHLTFTRACVGLKMFTGVALSLCALKSHPISQHASQNTSRRSWHFLIVWFLATTDHTHFTTADWNQEYLLCHFAGRKPVWLSGWTISSHRFGARVLHRSQQWAHADQLTPRGETASTSRMTLPPQSQPPRTSTVFISKQQPAAARSMYQ